MREQLLMLKSPWSYVPGIQRAINRWPDVYEHHLCYMLRGAGLYMELEAVK